MDSSDRPPSDSDLDPKEKRCFRILVPQAFQRSYFVVAQDKNEAILLVELGGSESRARGAQIDWRDSELVIAQNAHAWEVTEVKLESAHEEDRDSFRALDSECLPEGLSPATARLLAEDIVNSWDVDDLAQFAHESLIEQYLSDPRLFFEEWSERFDHSPTDVRALKTSEQDL